MKYISKHIFSTCSIIQSFSLISVRRSANSKRDGRILHMESVTRIASIPIIECSMGLAENYYDKIKVNLAISVYFFNGCI